MDENGCGDEGRFETCPYGIGCNTGVNCSRRDIFIGWHTIGSGVPLGGVRGTYDGYMVNRGEG